MVAVMNHYLKGAVHAKKLQHRFLLGTGTRQVVYIVRMYGLSLNLFTLFTLCNLVKDWVI